MTARNIIPKRLQPVQPTAGKRPHLVLVEGHKGGKHGLTVLNNLIIADRKPRGF
jgi:tRNA1(Val) A37 N6-methylase TrmN6